MNSRLNLKVIFLIILYLNLYKGEWNTFKPHLLFHLNEDKVNSLNFGIFY